MLKDYYEYFDKESAERERAELEKSRFGFDWNEDSFNSTFVFRFTAEGRVTGNYKEDEDIVLFKRIIDESAVGDELQLISYHEGYPAAYEEGWIVIYDVDALFSKVFTEKESILSLVDPGQTENCIYRFFEILKENEIRFDHDYFFMDQ